MANNHIKLIEKLQHEHLAGSPNLKNGDGVFDINIVWLYTIPPLELVKNRSTLAHSTPYNLAILPNLHLHHA